MPLEEVRTTIDQIDRMIAAADGYEDFVLGALLCGVRDHLEYEVSAHPTS